MKAPWLVKLEEEFKYFNETVSRMIKIGIPAIKKHPRDAVLKRAASQKQYDIYHSTTIEGYRITPEEVAAALLGPATGRKESGEELKNKMAIIGHALAFEHVLAMVKKDFGKPKLSEELISEIYFRLFKPSVDAGIIDRFDLVGYRKVKVYLRGSRYVPPSFEKVPDLIKSFVPLINGMGDNIIKAILAHYFLVTIHPYPDGNGRCGRLLMNYFLAASGYDWITITMDKREPYFQSLQKAQLEADIRPFAKFIFSFFTAKQMS